MTPPSPRSWRSSSERRARRRRSSASPTASPAGSCRPSSGSRRLTFVGWLLLGPEPTLTYALARAIAVLIIACPCAMGLATPTAIMVGTGKGAENGILIRDGAALELAQRITAVVLDKTGTITPRRALGHRRPCRARHRRAELLRLAAAAERGSEHPLGEAIVRRRRRGRDRPGDGHVVRRDRRSRDPRHGGRQDGAGRHGILPRRGRRGS